jgi:aminoglycoside phosphotransferase (APT) family kinase protein
VHPTSDASPDYSIIEFLNRSGLLVPGQTAQFESLAGGVSSDIWIVHSGDVSFCLKRALPRLRVAAEWLAPITRNANEVSWLNAVAGFIPGVAPRVLAQDAALGVFAMEYLPPTSYEPWKARLSRGVVDPAIGSLVGQRLASVHRAFAHSNTAAQEFANDETFYALRLEPYLVATARAHPELAAALEKILNVTARTKLSVVHGDVSPKNILVGSTGPVFIDAECAWFGDPAFDLAFCLNHLLLKTILVPPAEADLLRTFEALQLAYFDGVDWERPQSLEGRAAHLLPALLLARIDGKSPVEYLNDDTSKETVRRVARRLLLNPPDRLESVADAFKH